MLGAVLEPPKGPSSSSMAFSSMESELVDKLPRRMKVAVLVGEVPDRPIVVMESRRLWESLLPPLGNGGPVEPDEGPRWNRLDRAACVIELRR